MTPTPGNPSPSSSSQRAWGAAKVIIVGSVMFTFISYWKTAAVVLCDLASTAFYIGGIVEQAIGPAAPWFILGVMLFSYAVRSVYIESCSLFVRGGVYKVVKEAMGGTLAKISVSALMFDYILTGPISGASAGQYLIGLVLDALQLINPELRIADEGTRKLVRNWGSVVVAIGITLYFGYKNLIGIHESSDKAFKIMIATTVMAVVILIWCGITLVVRDGPVNPIVVAPELGPKVQYQDATGFQLTRARMELLVDKVQHADWEKLKSLLGKPFRRESDFENAVKKVLGFPAAPAQAQKDVLEAIKSRAKLVKWYKLTDDSLENLKDDAGLTPTTAPTEVVDKLEALKNQEFKFAAEFKAHLAQVLTREEVEKYQDQLVGEAEVTESFDRVTGEQNLHGGEPKPITDRILGRDRDVYLDLNGGSRIPKISERKARSVAELRAAGIGVDRVLLIHDGSQESKDLFQAILTMMDPEVPLTLVSVGGTGPAPNGAGTLQPEQGQARKVGREILVQPLQGDPGVEIVKLAREGQYRLLVLPVPPELSPGQTIPPDSWVNYLLRHAPCRVLLASPPVPPEELAE